LAQRPRPSDAVKLRGVQNAYRVRVGHYRILYEVHDDRLLILVIGVAHRREAYRR